MNRTVNLLKRVTTKAGSRYCAVVTSGNGRVKPDYVTVDGKQEYHKEGAYYLSWYEGTRLKRVSVGRDANAADAKRHKQEQILGARSVGAIVVDPTEKKDGHLVVNASTDYLTEIKAQKKEATHKSYRNSLRLFEESCTKQTIEEIDRADLLAFITFMRDRGFTPYTIHMRFSVVMSFLRAQGKEIVVTKGDLSPATEKKLFLKKTDIPKYAEAEPEIYEKADLDKFFAACNEVEHLWFNFFLMTGMRDQEVMHCSWKCANFSENTISVKDNPTHGWTMKTRIERTIPVPQELMDELKVWRDKRDKRCDLLFPSVRCQPYQQFWDAAKAVAERAGLDPETFWLHKFRATFATWHLWNGVDLRTVQAWLGHTELTSTMRYLRPNRTKAVRDKVESTFRQL